MSAKCRRSGGPRVLTLGPLPVMLGGTRHEVFWDGCAGRQVYATIEFAQPTDVRAITVCENPKFPASWPTQGLIRLWDEKLKQSSLQSSAARSHSA